MEKGSQRAAEQVSGYPDSMASIDSKPSSRHGLQLHKKPVPVAPSPTVFGGDKMRNAFEATGMHPLPKPGASSPFEQRFTPSPGGLPQWDIGVEIAPPTQRAQQLLKQSHNPYLLNLNKTKEAPGGTSGPGWHSPPGFEKELKRAENWVPKDHQTFTFKQQAQQGQFRRHQGEFVQSPDPMGAVHGIGIWSGDGNRMANGANMDYAQMPQPPIQRWLASPPYPTDEHLLHAPSRVSYQQSVENQATLAIPMAANTSEGPSLSFSNTTSPTSLKPFSPPGLGGIPGGEPGRLGGIRRFPKDAAAHPQKPITVFEEDMEYDEDHKKSAWNGFRGQNMKPRTVDSEGFKPAEFSPKMSWPIGFDAKNAPRKGQKPERKAASFKTAMKLVSRMSFGSECCPIPSQYATAYERDLSQAAIRSKGFQKQRGGLGTSVNCGYYDIKKLVSSEGHSFQTNIQTGGLIGIIGLAIGFAAGYSFCRVST